MMKKNSLPVALPNQALTLTFTLIGFLSFSIPFSFGHPQLLVGAIVNATLFSAALFLPDRFIYPIIFLPSLGILSRGLIFGPLTSFLVFILPFIWLGNWLLTFGFRFLFNQGKNYWFSIFGSAILKSLFLFSASLLLFKMGAVPKLFLSTMGYIQFITASLGGVICFFIKKSTRL